MAESQIEWTEMTWNPVTGCNKVSQGCKFCYAEVMSRRLKAMGVDKYRNGFRLTLQPDALDVPYQWNKPRLVFVNSMSDLFHKDVPLPYLRRVFKVMNECSKHTFQVLTKRPDRLAELSKHFTWTPNIWMGTSVENESVIERVDFLRASDARVKFLSLEPLLGPLPSLNLHGIHWVIVGGESGPGARYMDPKWVTQIRAKCRAAKVPFFFKQWGGTNKKRAGRVLDGKTYDEMPKSYKPLIEHARA